MHTEEKCQFLPSFLAPSMILVDINTLYYRANASGRIDFIHNRHLILRGRVAERTIHRALIEYQFD
jgi:hypothetical protein